jgi:hypothetical protein
MALAGQAALAMWWDMTPAMTPEFEHWHSHEHFPERLALPGFLRASRWRDAGGGHRFFVLYELERHETLSTPEYLARLNAPTPWSRQLMPHHGNMVRSQCRVLASRGGGVARCALTLRLKPAAGGADALQAHLGRLAERAVAQPGITGAHLLATETPALAATVEQKIRGGADRAADWIVVLNGYDENDLLQFVHTHLGAGELATHGGEGEPVADVFQLSLSMVPADPR